MTNNENLKPFPKFCPTIGMIPASYKESLTYEEQLLYLLNKIDEIICFINNILEQKINDYIEKMFNDIMIDSMYEADTETLILFLKHN